MILKQRSFSKKLGDNIVTVTNNVLTHMFEDFRSCEFFPCFTIICDTGKLTDNFRNEGDISTRCLLLSVDFFLYINMGMCLCLLYLIKIFKMAAELYRDVFPARQRCLQETVSHSRLKLNRTPMVKAPTEFQSERH